MERGADVKPILKDILNGGDLLMTQGAGDIGSLALKLAQELPAVLKAE